MQSDGGSGRGVWQRRGFLASPVAFGLTALGISKAGRSAPRDPFAADAPDWVAGVRRQIPAAQETRYFQTGGIGVCPRGVIERVHELLEYQNRGPADPRFATKLQEAEDFC